MHASLKRMIDALERGRRFASQDVWAIGRPGEEIPKGFVIKQVRVFILLVTNLVESSMMLRAAALTFATTLAIVPFLAVFFFVIQTLNLGEGVYEQLQTRLESALGQTSGVAGDETDIDGAGALLQAAPPAGEATQENAATPSEAAAKLEDERGATESVQRQLARAVFRGVGQQQDNLEDPVDWLINLADEAATDPRALSVAGIILVLATVFGLMRNIEKAFNDIWGVKRSRSWYRTISDYVMITLLLPVIALAVLAVTAALQSQQISDSLGSFRLLLQGAQFLVIVLVFASLYYVVPNTRVRIPFALLGGAVAGAVWIFLSWTYVEFQVGLTKYNIVFAGFAQFPMLLMWVYLSWVVLLFGSQLSFAYQNEETYAMERFAEGASYAYREALALRALLEIAHRFQREMPGPAASDLARTLNVPTRLVNEMLEKLEAGGFVAACATEPVTYQPARPPEKIVLGEVVKTIREAGREPSQLRKDGAFESVFDELDASRTETMQYSLQTILDRFEAQGNAGSSTPRKGGGESVDTDRATP